ncbi:hypothetical protein FPV67DRAFT_565533 [Lyophyllum atratum]|nr:hypothetical protein FPV67DRAFT_565533 [Lyophyllum atratum]
MSKFSWNPLWTREEGRCNSSVHDGEDSRQLSPVCIALLSGGQERRNIISTLAFPSTVLNGSFRPSSHQTIRARHRHVRDPGLKWNNLILPERLRLESNQKEKEKTKQNAPAPASHMRTGKTASVTSVGIKRTFWICQAYAPESHLRQRLGDITDSLIRRVVELVNWVNLEMNEELDLTLKPNGSLHRTEDEHEDCGNKRLIVDVPCRLEVRVGK